MLTVHNESVQMTDCSNIQFADCYQGSNAISGLVIEFIFEDLDNIVLKTSGKFTISHEGENHFVTCAAGTYCTPVLQYFHVSMHLEQLKR